MRMPAWAARRIHRWASTPGGEEWKWYHWLFVTPIMLFFIGASVWISYTTIQDIAQEKEHARLIEKYQSANGTMLSFQLTDPKTSEYGITTYTPIVLYSYIVDGKEYTSSRISPKPFRVHEHSDFTRNRQAGKIAKIYYDPDSPDKSLLAKEIPMSGWTKILFSIVFSSITGLAVTSLLVKIASKLCDDPDA